MDDILFLTAGSYSDYHVLGAFIGEMDRIEKVKKILEPIFKDANEAEIKYYGTRSEETRDALREDLRRKRDRISLTLFDETAKEQGVRYIDQSDDNTLWRDD